MAATDGCDFESDTDSSIICVCVCVWKFQQNFLLFLETVFGFTSKTASVMGDFGFLNYSFFFSSLRVFNNGEEILWAECKHLVLSCNGPLVAVSAGGVCV